MKNLLTRSPGITPHKLSDYYSEEFFHNANLPAPDEAALKRGPVLLIVRKGGDASRTAAFFASARLLTTVKREAGLNPRDAYDVHLLEGYRGGLFQEQRQQAGPSCGAVSNWGTACN